MTYNAVYASYHQGTFTHYKANAFFSEDAGRMVATEFQEITEEEYNALRGEAFMEGTKNNGFFRIEEAAEEVIEYFDRSDYRSMYEQVVEDLGGEGLNTYDECILNIANAVAEKQGDLDDAVAIFDDMIHNMQLDAYTEINEG